MYNKAMEKKPILIFLGIVILLIGVIAGLFVSLGFAPKPSTASNSVRADIKAYAFINPLIYSENARSNDPRLNKLESSMTDYISTIKKADSSSAVSVYFRDLNSGAWTGVGEDETYKPSSMLKTVAMIAAYKQSETRPGLLSQKLYMKRSPTAQALFVPDDNEPSGYYSLQDLIDITIKYSDNDAVDALLSDPGINGEYNQIFSLLRLPNIDLSDPDADYMSPKSFSTIFRALYNSSLLSWGVSENILSLLSQTTFTDGLVAGVQAGTPVAHKFGENTDELHDCGIVYHPDNPYLLCVMTKGSKLDVLESAIAGVSKIAYQFADQEKTSNVATTSAAQ